MKKMKMEMLNYEEDLSHIFINNLICFIINLQTANGHESPDNNNYN